MAAACEIIKKLRDQGDMSIKDGVALTLFRPEKVTPSRKWVQYRKRKQVGSGADEVYYEVYEIKPNQLVAQLHYKYFEDTDSKMLNQLRKKVADDPHFCGICRSWGEEKGYLISCGEPINVTDCDVGMILDKLRDDIKVLYGAFEGIIAKYDSQCPVTTNKVECVKKRSDNKKPIDKKWFVNYKYDTSACDDRYDGKLKDIPGLTWLPWVGKGYCGTRILVVGESNYTDDGMAEIVDGDKWFTRKVSNYFCISEQERRAGQAMRYIARRLMTSVHDTVPKVWSQIAYMDVCQKCLVKVEGERPRPTPDNYESGVLPVCSVVDVLRPKLVIFVSKGAFDYFKNRQCLRKALCCSRLHVLHGSRCGIFKAQPMELDD